MLYVYETVVWRSSTGPHKMMFVNIGRWAW